MDKVFIEGLEIEALIGIYDWERRIRQPLVFDLEMQFDNRIPAASDAIADTLDYKAVSKRVIEFVGQSGFGLVETLAERVAALVLEEFDVEHVRLKLSKPGAVRGARAVGVIIERARSDVARAAPSPRRETRDASATASPVVMDAVRGLEAEDVSTALSDVDLEASAEAAIPTTIVTSASTLEAALLAAVSGWHEPRREALQETPDDDHVGPAASQDVAERTETPAEAAEAAAEAPAEAPAEALAEAPTEALAGAPAEAADAADAPAQSPAEAAAADSAEAPAGSTAQASAEAEIALPPVTASVEYERYANRPRTLAASVARTPAPTAEAAARPGEAITDVSPAPARANFMRDLDEAPVRPVSASTPGEPDSLLPVAPDAAAAPQGEAPQFDVAPAGAAAELAHDAAPSADAVVVEAASTADVDSSTPDAGSATQTDADAAPAAAAPTRAAPPPPPRPRNPASDLGRTTRPAYLSLGSNIEPEQNLRSALMALRARFGEVIVSPVYRMPAVGFDGPDFLNAAAIIDSDLDPFALTRWLHGIENAHGRMRTHVKNSSRTLDMDIIFFDDLVLDMPGGLQLPRPELRHAFVLKPMVDIAPGYIDPVRGVHLVDLWTSHPEHAQRFSTVAI